MKGVHMQDKQESNKKETPKDSAHKPSSEKAANHPQKQFARPGLEKRG